MRVTRGLLTFAATLVVACAATPKHRVPIATIVDGDRTKVGAIAPHAVAGLELQPFEPPRPAVTVDDSSAIVAKARAAYVGGEFDACRGELARVDIGRLLATGQRALAGRAIAFDAACAYGAQNPMVAKGLAAKLAAMGLELPDAPFARDAELILTTAITAAGNQPRHALQIGGTAGARLFVDGKYAGCTLPCTVDVPSGDHFFAVELDGHMPAARWIAITKPATIDFDPPAASPVVAIEQWHARIGKGLPPNDAVGAKLVALVSGQPRIVLVHGGARVTGTMIVDGEIRARGERDAGEAAQLVRELAYDARILKRPALWQQPKFWIATSIAVAVIAGVVVYAVYEPDVESTLRF